MKNLKSTQYCWTVLSSQTASGPRLITWSLYDGPSKAIYDLFSKLRWAQTITPPHSVTQSCFGRLAIYLLLRQSAPVFVKFFLPVSSICFWFLAKNSHQGKLIWLITSAFTQQLRCLHNDHRKKCQKSQVCSHGASSYNCNNLWP